MAYNFQKVKILIVEDSGAIYDLLQTTLCTFAVPRENIFRAATMQDGFSQFCLHNHDLVLTGRLQDPHNGIALTKLIRMHEASPNRYVPVIMASGSAHRRSVIAARDAGVSEYLVLPYSARGLAKKITRAIEFPRPFVVSKAYLGPDRRIGEGGYAGPDRRAGEGERQRSA